ncbi:MAG: L,D-transpeptidase family protein [Thermodesulfobacteriota bacterium]
MDKFFCNGKVICSLQKAKTGYKQSRTNLAIILLLTFLLAALILMSGCGHFNEASQARPVFQEANTLFNQGNYPASLSRYRHLIEKYPNLGDRVLFEMGIIYAYSENKGKDYQKALDCFQKIIRQYPESGFRKDSEIMIFQISTLMVKDKTIAAQQTLITALREENQNKEKEILTLGKQVQTLEQDLKVRLEELTKLQKEVSALRLGPVEKVLIEKKERRLTLSSKGQALKTYKIALGGNPVGAKERHGDHKTPEGTYLIDAKNRDSQYHLSLHISYPNERDKKRAKALGVSPGGDIMIHGLKNGLGWVGDSHTGKDWTRGCIAVTDEEIEEIFRLVPIGTPVEIRP